MLPRVPAICTHSLWAFYNLYNDFYMPGTVLTAFFVIIWICTRINAVYLPVALGTTFLMSFTRSKCSICELLYIEAVLVYRDLSRGWWWKDRRCWSIPSLSKQRLFDLHQIFSSEAILSISLLIHRVRNKGARELRQWHPFLWPSPKECCLYRRQRPLCELKEEYRESGSGISCVWAHTAA